MEKYTNPGSLPEPEHVHADAAGPDSAAHEHTHDPAVQPPAHAHGHSHDSSPHAHEHTHDPETQPHAHEHAHDPAAHAHNHPNQKAVSNRLARAIGHLQAVKTMVDNGEDCAQVLIQLAAVRAAITNAGKLLLTDHINH